MSRPATLERAAINLAAVRDAAKRELIDILDSLSGSKCLVLDPRLGKHLNHIVLEGTQLLRDHGVQIIRELGGTLAFEDGQEPQHVVYLARPNVSHMHVIARQLTARPAASATRYHLFFVPRRTLVCEQVLDDAGVRDALSIGEFGLDLIPYDNDLLSLEWEQVFKECFVDGDRSSLYTVARSVMKLQTLFGVIPNIRAKGRMSSAVANLLQRIRREEAATEVGNVEPEIDTIVLLDRDVDLCSPLVSPLTYEALVDEVINISNGCVRLDPSMMDPDTPEEERRRPMALNSNDPLYAEIRAYNVEKLGPYLASKALEIQESYSSFRNNKDQSISEIHDFLRRVPGLQQGYRSLNQHINIAEVVKRKTDAAEFRERWQVERSMLEGETAYDHLEGELAAADVSGGSLEPLFKLLRLLSLQSLTNGGLKSKAFDGFRRELLQTFGFDLLPTLHALEKVGMLKRRESSWVDTSSTWGSLRRLLRLIDDSVNVVNPSDVAYVTSGYAPLSVRLVQAVARPGWDACGDALRLLPGPTEIVRQESPGATAVADRDREQAATGAPQRKKVMLVFFVGGLSYVELAGLRYLSAQPYSAFPYTIIAATTKLVNGNSLIEPLLVESVGSRLAAAARGVGGVAAGAGF